MEENVQEKGMTVKGINELNGNNGNYKPEIFTTIDDPKILFNLENSVDFLINDLVGTVINVVDCMVKIFDKPLKEPKRKTIIDKETGEIIETDEMITSERNIITILIDNEGKSYLTKSKNFFFAWNKLTKFYDIDTIKKGINIKIKKVKAKTGNSTLTFEIV